MPSCGVAKVTTLGIVRFGGQPRFLRWTWSIAYRTISPPIEWATTLTARP